MDSCLFAGRTTRNVRPAHEARQNRPMALIRMKSILRIKVFPLRVDSTNMKTWVREE